LLFLVVELVDQSKAFITSSPLKTAQLPANNPTYQSSDLGAPRREQFSPGPHTFFKHQLYEATGKLHPKKKLSHPSSLFPLFNPFSLCTSIPPASRHRK
jgi:hypothetical protein